MKKYICLFCVILAFVCVSLSGCSLADKIEPGVYVCETPYIEYECGLGKDYDPMLQIEIDRVVYDAFALTGYDSIITYIEYQQEDAVGGRYADDNETYAEFQYKFDFKKKQLILTDKETGNVYHLDKVG